VRELRYAPLDREQATQCLNSFIWELKASPRDEGSSSNFTSRAIEGTLRADACSAGSVASLAWALSFTKHKRKFVAANAPALLALASVADRRCVCARVCVCACMRVCVCVRVRACVGVGGQVWAARVALRENVCV